MGASAKREKRVKMRKMEEKQTGSVKRAKNVHVLDSKGETDQVSQKLSKKKFTTHDLCSLTPRNDRQYDFLESYYSGADIITATGPAGTAKTFLSMYCALSDAFEDGNCEIDRVIVIRSAVETRSQGFLPGTLEEKSEPYESPYSKIAKEIMPEYNDPYSHLKSLGYLQFYTTAHLRGLTFNRSVVIVDEIQNFDYDELVTVITRLGLHSKIILCGDLKQNDLKRQREKSGLEKLMEVVDRMQNVYYSHIEYGLEDIERSGLVKEFIKADYFSEH